MASRDKRCDGRRRQEGGRGRQEGHHPQELKISSSILIAAGCKSGGVFLSRHGLVLPSMPRTMIVCAVEHASGPPEMLERLAAAGMDVAR